MQLIPSQHELVRFGMVAIVNFAATRAGDKMDAIEANFRLFKMGRASRRVGIKMGHFSFDGGHAGA